MQIKVLKVSMKLEAEWAVIRLRQESKVGNKGRESKRGQRVGLEGRQLVVLALASIDKMHTSGMGWFHD